MSTSIPKVSYKSMMKEGTRSFQGLEEAVYRSIDACKQLQAITRTSFGPNGMKKIIVNYLDKLFITKDAATILKELEVEHPAAKLLVMASKMAEQEVGDGTNFVIQLSGSLLSGAAELLNLGITAGSIIDGYKAALKQCDLHLNEIACCVINDVRDLSLIIEPIRSAIATKQLAYADHFARLIATACVNAKPVHKREFDVDNVRTVKIIGAGGLQSEVRRGLVVKADASGTVTDVENAKLAVFSIDFDLMHTETKGTVLLSDAAELLAFSKGEEDAVKTLLSGLRDAGVNVVICSGRAADQFMDYANRFGIMVVRIQSKFEIERLCRATSASCLPSICLPNPEQLGHCDHVFVQEIGDTNVVVFAQESEESAVSTIIIRGSSDTLLDDLELAVDDGVNCFKSLNLNGKLLPGAGATEMNLCVLLDREAPSREGMEQHAFAKFAEALKDVVRCICENNGMKSNLVLPQLYAEHYSGKTNMGLDICSPSSTCDVTSHGILDLYYVKTRCLQIAVDLVATLLSIDQIVMARPSGGPVPRQNPNWDAD